MTKSHPRPLPQLYLEGYAVAMRTAVIGLEVDIARLIRRARGQNAQEQRYIQRQIEALEATKRWLANQVPDHEERLDHANAAKAEYTDIQGAEAP